MKNKRSKSFLFESSSPRETERFGRRLGHFFRGGTVMAVIGDLGSGKTTLIRGIASGLGVSERTVKSPTFVLMHIYKGRLPVYHFDLYRLARESDAAGIGIDEFASDPHAVSLIEWADRIPGILPEDYFSICIEGFQSDRRKFRVEARGHQSKSIFKQFLRHEHSRD